MGDLIHALDELLALHRVHLLDRREMLRRERWDPLVGDLHFWRAYRVPDRKDARIEHADDVAGISLVHDLALLRHELLRLGKLDVLSLLHVIIFRAALEFARTDAHKGEPVAVRLVHVRLNFEYKRRKGAA